MLTRSRYLCLSCRHRGPAVIVSESVERHPDGDGYSIETLCELECEDCSSTDLVNSYEE